MGYAAEKLEGVAAARRRPNKALRALKHHACNLSAFDAVIPTRSATGDSGPHTATEAGSQQSQPTEYVVFGSQPPDQVAANSDSTVTGTVAPAFASKNQLTMAILGCLSVGAVLGYHWSTAVNQNQVLFAPAVTTEPPVNPEFAEIKTTIGDRSAPQALAESPAAQIKTATASRADQAEHGYLEEIDWLTEQNRNLKLEVDELTQESLALNKELLQLELETVALRLQSEPPAETRIVYNFVDVPIGGDINSQSSNRGYTQNSTSAASSTSVQQSVPNTVNRQGLPLNVPQTNEQYLDEEDYLDDDDYLDEEEYLEEQEDEEYERYLESLESEGYLDADMLDEKSEQELWELYSGRDSTERELGYNPDTGFYVNEQYNNVDTQYESQNVIQTYPPIPTP